jgi:hypothetical protein
MHRIAAGCFAVVMLIAPAAAAPPNGTDLASNAAMAAWLNRYRTKPDPERLPLLVRMLSQRNAFKDAEASGAYVGFIAGVIGSNPARAEDLVARMLAIAPSDHWVLVRAIAYSGRPEWKKLLAGFIDRMPARRAMIEKYLAGKLPTLDQIAYDKEKLGLFDKLGAALHPSSKRKKPVALEPSPELIDTLWGYYLATGTYPPIARIIRLLPCANDRDSVERLTAGSAAKYTLASNAVRDAALLAMLKSAVKQQTKETVAVLNDVIETAETVDTARMRKDALAAIEEVKIKGPASKREMNTMAMIGQGAVSLGCVVAAALGQIELGIPCLIGGAATSAAGYYIGR